MAKKIMLWPSARSKFVKDANMKLIYKTLLVLSAVMILLNYYMYGFMYGIKLLLMVVIAIIVTIEVEILFYSIDKDISRQESKDLIKKSYPKITALIYVLLIPIGTPLWLVGLGAGLATLLGKLFFGGFHHMVFHSSLVGVIFVTQGWPGLVDGVPFITSFDNYLLELLFDNTFFQETLSIGNLYDPSSIGVLEALQEMLTSLTYGINVFPYSISNILIGVAPGIIGSGLLILVIGVFLIVKKAINYIVPVSMIGSFLVIAAIIALSNSYDFGYLFVQLFGGSFLFVVLFIATDPITTPISTPGKIIFGVIAGSLTMVIRNAGTYVEGVFFAVGFMMILTPMLNTFFKAKPKKKVVQKKEAV